MDRLRAATIPLFRDLTETSRQELITAGKWRELKKGEQLFMHGEPLHSFYLMIDGAIRKFRETPEGKEITVELVMRGDMVGASHIFESFTTYQWTAAATENSTLLEYPIGWFKDRVKRDGTLAVNLLAAMSHQTHTATVDAEHLVTFTAAQRVSCFLLRLCSLYDLDPSQFELPFSKSTIASKLGMELETFSRSLQKLKEVGIHVKGAQVAIQDLPQLECFACGHCSISEDCETLANVHRGQCHSDKVLLSKVK